MQKGFIVLALCFFIFLTACNTASTGSDGSGSSSTGNSGTDTTSTGSAGSGATSSGSAGSSGSGGSSTSSTDFVISGKLSSLSVSALGLENVTTGTVTHVMAVSPQAGSVSCQVGTVSSNGNFQLKLKPGQLWTLFFLNSMQRGSSMFSAMFRSSAMNALMPKKTGGSSDLGTLSINSSTQTATGTTSYKSIIDDFGVDSDIADAVSAKDAMATRYQNPDMDGDGEIDCKDSKKFMLDFHVRYDTLLNGKRATVSDVIDNYFSDTTTTFQYSSTGVYVSYPKTFSSASTGSVTFADSSVTTSEGGAIAANTATSSVTNNDYGEYHSFGPNITNSSELPSGKIVFTVGSKTLTFTGLQPPALSELNTPTGRIFAFIRFDKADSTCTSNCKMASVSYKWMKRTSIGWTAATLNELAWLVSDSGAFISIRYDNSSSKAIGITIPMTSLSGTIPWTSSQANLSGITATEFGNMVTTQICHLGLSHDDKAGMRYFESIDDVTGTCQ